MKGRNLLVHRKSDGSRTCISVNGITIGAEEPIVIAGPCSVESLEQMEIVASSLRKLGIRCLRGGAFKPRTSPYDFQGLGVQGIEILRKVADQYGMIVVSEIMSVSQLDLFLSYVDILQVGARNMHNYDLLKALGTVQKPILLKRGLSATIEELLYAAEYIALQGNQWIILCERGIRTYEKATRNTLDISAVPILKSESCLPVIVDVSHSTGRKDIMLPVAKAALAAGADGLMIEVHPNPPKALSDSNQQMNLDEFAEFFNGLCAGGFLKQNQQVTV